MGMGLGIFLHPDMPSKCRETVALYCTGSQNELEGKGEEELFFASFHFA